MTMLAQLVPVGSFSSLLSLTGIVLFVFCLVLIISQKASGWFTVFFLFALGAGWVGISRGVPAEDTKASDGYAILWKWEDNTFHRDAQWQTGSLYEDCKKERYYSMHVTGKTSPYFYHPDALWVAPVIALFLGLLFCPSIWPLLFVIIAGLCSLGSGGSKNCR